MEVTAQATPSGMNSDTQTTESVDASTPDDGLDAEGKPRGDMTPAQAREYLRKQQLAADQKKTEKKEQAKSKSLFKQAADEAKSGTSLSKSVDASTPDERAGAVAKDVKEAEVVDKIRRYKLKVDGQDIEVDEDELKRGYGHQTAANKRYQQGAAMMKQAEEFVKMMRDPEKFFEVAKKMGHDRSRFEKYLVNELQYEMMTPEQKEAHQAKLERDELRKEIQAVKDREAREKEEQTKKVHEALKAKFAQDYQQQFISALETVGLPATKHMFGEMAKYVKRAADVGYKISAEDAAKLVQEDVRVAHQRLIGDTDGEMLLKLLGENVANKIRKHDTSRLKDPRQYLSTPTQQSESTRSRGASARMSPKEWREYNRRK